MSVDDSHLSYNDQLMETVKKYPAIYDKQAVEYKDKVAKQNAWEQVAKEMDKNVLDAQKRYNTIRTKLSKYLNKEQLSDSVSTEDLKPRFQSLAWLVPHIETRNMKTRSKRSHYSDDEIDEMLDNDLMDSSDTSLPTQVPNRSNFLKRTRTIFHPQPSEQLFNEDVRMMVAGDHLQQKDYDYMFCASLIPKFAVLNEDQREFAQIEILQVLRKARLMLAPDLAGNISDTPKNSQQSQPCPPLQPTPQHAPSISLPPTW